MDDTVVFRFKYKVHIVDIEVDVDRCNLMDLIIDFEDELQRRGVVIVNLMFAYAYRGKHWPIDDDGGIQRMYRTFPGAKMYEILVGTNPLRSSYMNDLVSEFRRNKLVAEVGDFPPPPTTDPDSPPLLNDPTYVPKSALYDINGDTTTLVAKLGDVPPPPTVGTQPSPTQAPASPNYTIKYTIQGETTKLKPRRKLVKKYLDEGSKSVAVSSECDAPTSEPLVTMLGSEFNYDPYVTWADLVQDNEEGNQQENEKTRKEYTKGRKEFEKVCEKANAALSSAGVKPKGKGKGSGSAAVSGKGKGKLSETGKVSEEIDMERVVTSGGEKYPPSPISPHTVFKTLAVRRSPRFSPIQPTIQTNVVPSSSPHPRQSAPITDPTLFARKIAKTTARRKGILISAKSKGVLEGKKSVEPRARRKIVYATNDGDGGGDPSESSSSTGDDSEDDDFEGNEFDGDDESDVEVVPTGEVPEDERVELNSVPHIEDNWEAGFWAWFVDSDDDDDYFKKLYGQGEVYEEVKFGKITVRPWMLFIDKAHLRETLKDYAVQEGFALNVIAADNKKYTVTCYAECCEWRLHASRLSDGKTWAIKKIWPDVHNCRGLETYNPICTVKWAAPKVMEDIRAAPDIPGKALNELLFQRFGIHMKQASLYRLKKYVIEELFGGHDESYSHLPRYADMICATNPESKAFVGWTLSESIPRVNLFSTMFISFAGQWKGFLAGCRPLIGVDGAHLKGNYGGVLLSAVAIDGNNEIFPLAYAIVSGEDKETWSYFLWQIYNIVKDSGRKDWTIISDRQKGVDIALTNVWPNAKRRYCCRHLSRNYKKAFPGPLMYILFWRACNATNIYSFRKAMERLQKEGGADVMKWFADLGDQSKWSKHKFDPNVCNDSNTSNFVESFNSTLGVDRCRPVLTLLEGIRRVCMVRIASRHQRAQDWNDEDLCPKIAKLLREISKATSTCRAYQSSPGEYEIHEGKSQFPLSLNSKICSCGAWQLSGIPCRHAVRAMLHAKVDPHNYVSSWYSAKTYKQVYCHAIHPIPDFSQWPPADPNHPTQIAPPKMKRGVGRPSRNRRREEGEEQPGKRARTVRCSSCGNFGHNKKTCKGGLTGKELKASEALVVKNPRVRDQSNAAKQAAAKSKAAGAATEISSSQMSSQPQDLSQSQP